MENPLASPVQRPGLPPRLEGSAMVRGSLEMSPTRSSIHSSSSQSRVHTPSSSVPDTPLIPTRPASPEKRPVHPGESNTFLTALAAQERRVLELKEDLHKAEIDLEKLKKQWARHEAVKKRNEIRHPEQLQPLNTPSSSSTLSREDDSIRCSRELDRRKLPPINAKASQRKVFEGRHTRTLSLLSPRESTSQQVSFLRDRDEAENLSHKRPPTTQIPPTVSETGTPQSVSINDQFKGTDKDALLETGKQIVGDFRQGLWTFFEDLKQVTVGEEASDPRPSPHYVGNGSKRATARSRRNTIVESPVSRRDVTMDMPEKPKQDGWNPGKGAKAIIASNREESVARNPKTPKPKPCSEQTNLETSDSDDGEWDSWDSPNCTPQKGVEAQTADSMASPLTDNSTPRTSMR